MKPVMRAVVLQWLFFQLHYVRGCDGQLCLNRGREMNRHIRHRQEQGQDGDGQYEERGILINKFSM